MNRVQFLPVGRMLAMRAELIGGVFDVPPSAAAPYTLEGPLAVVNVRGPVVQHRGQMRPNGWGEWDSYDAIIDRGRAAAAAPGARAMCLKIDSPGGDALGVFECARELRAICRAASMPLYAFVDGMACSAAYALATAAEQVVTPPAGELGSVGVYQTLVDATAADRAMGLAFTIVASGERKLDGNPHVPATDGTIEEVRTRVNALAELFFSLIAEMRPMATTAGMRELQGRTLLGAEAVRMRLADSVGSWSDVLAMAASPTRATASAAPAVETRTMDPKKEAARAAMKSALDAATKMALESAFPSDEEGGGETSDEEKKKKDEDAKKAAAAAAATKAKEGSVAAEEEDAAAKALAAGFVPASEVAKLAAKHNALEARLAAKDVAEQRATLYASRPDFTPAQKKTLDLLPITEVKAACETWEKIPVSAAAAALVQATRGKRHTDAEQLAPIDAKEAAEMDRQMGLTKPLAGVSHAGGSLELGSMTPEEAKIHLDKLKAAGVTGYGGTL